MSQQEPDGPYVYQPFGGQHRAHAESGRLWGVGGLHLLAKIEGLTRDEATAVVVALKVVQKPVPPAPRQPFDVSQACEMIRNKAVSSNRS